MDIQKIDKALPIQDCFPVRFKDCGNVKEIMYSSSRSNGGVIKKIDKNNYIDKRTGEIKEFYHIENRSQDLNNVAKSLAFGRDLLNTNIIDVSFCRWLTLTYKENMTDAKQLLKDFRDFNKRCRAIFGHYEYITCAEPQGRGAWHLHVVLIFPSKAPFMDNSIVADCWKKGFVTIKKLENVDNVGAYLTAYLGDIDLEEGFQERISINTYQIKEIEFKDENGAIKTKRFIKGGRLYLYPPGFHIFRYSKGIKKPLVENISYKEAKEKIGSLKPTFSKSVLLSDTETGFNNTLVYEYYNKLRQ